MITARYSSLLSMMCLIMCALFSMKDTQAQVRRSIQGQVFNAEMRPLPGASVSVQGASITVATDLNGRFVLNNVPTGERTLVFNYMGYETLERPVQVANENVLLGNVVLTLNAEKLGVVEITAVMEGQQKALNQQRMADNIKQVISADVMGRYPDLNVAESLQRLPGVTIGRNSSGEGAKVQLRGTPGNFTNININGEQMMGSDENGARNPSLDVIPVNVLSSMEVIKTLTPDLDGDAIAGTINMKTPTAASMKTVATLDVGVGYNDLRSKINNIVNGGLGKRFLPSDAVPNGRLGVIATGSYFRTQNGYDDLRAQVWEAKDYGFGEIYFPTDIRYLYMQNDRKRFGTSATVDYVVNPSTTLVANMLYSSHNNDLTRYRKRTSMQSARTTYDAESGSFVNARGRGYNEVMAGTEDNDVLTFSLEGETKIGGVMLDAAGFYSQSEMVYRGGTYNFITGNINLQIDDIETDFLEASGADWKNDASLYTYNAVERNYWNTKGQNYTARLNGSYSYSLWGNDALFKAGVKYKRMNNQRWRPDNTLVTTYAGDAATGNLSNFAGVGELSDNLLDGHTNFGLAVDRDKTISFLDQNLGTDLFPINERATRSSIDSYFYNSEETIRSGYLMNRVQINKLMFLAGVRLEHNQVDYAGNIIETDDTEQWVSTTPNFQSNSYVKVLPNVQFKYDLDRSSLLRLAWTYGYSRANFVDLVPGRLINLLGEAITDGNPDLQPATSMNLDLMYEKYLSNLGIISAGTFYKRIDQFQYNSVFALTGNEFDGADAYTGWRWFRTLNGDVAHVAGVEVNVQSNLTFLPGILSGLSVMANYTYTYSNADAQFREDLRLPGQAAHTGNASLSFTYKRFSIQGNVNYNGAYTELLGDQDATDVIRHSRLQLDANMAFKITPKISLYAEGVNLTGAPQIDYFGQRNRIYQNQFYSFWGRAGIKMRL